MPKMHYLLKSMLAIAAVIIVLGIAVNVSAALNPQPEPPIVYKIGMHTASGLFSGEIVAIPPAKIMAQGNNTDRGLFSGEIVSMALRPQA
jgi:hypothetical protein